MPTGHEDDTGTSVYDALGEEWWQMDMGSEVQVAGVVTQGSGSTFTGSVTSFTIDASADAVTWAPVDGGRTFYSVSPNSNAMKVQNVFESPVSARYIRIHPQSYFYSPDMRAGVLLVDCMTPGNMFTGVLMIVIYDMGKRAPSTVAPPLIPYVPRRSHRLRVGQLHAERAVQHGRVLPFRVPRDQLHRGVQSGVGAHACRRLEHWICSGGWCGVGRPR